MRFLCHDQIGFGRISKFCRSARKVAICLALCALSVPAFGVAITDTSYSGYVTGNGSFTGVAEILFNYVGRSGTYLCSGSLISDYQILTAGHCASGAENWSVIFETPSGSTSIGVTSALVHPDYSPRPSPYTLLSEYDIAILTLASLAPSDASRYMLATTFDGDFPVSPLEIVGFGLGGSADTGVQPAGVRRQAVNTIEGLYPFVDSPLRMTMRFGAEPGNYGLINGGDSGSPAFYNGSIVGVASFANLPSFGSYSTSVTYESGHTSLLDPATGNWVASMLIPEPGTIGLLAAGLAALILLGRRRRRL
jgi:hypothetical protein